MKLHGSLCILIFLIWCPSLNSAKTYHQYYPIQSSQAYTWSSSFPQSCSCAESGVTTTSCTLFQCSCLCDITAGVCDYDCCCDPDCSSDQTSRFSSLSSCAYQGGFPDTTQYCYSSNDLYAVNPRSPMQGTPTAEEGLNGALCVVKTNYAISEEFYTDDEMQSSTIFQQSAGQKTYSYTTINEIESSAVTADNYYDQNDTMAGFMNSSTISGFVSNGPGFFQIPSVDFDGACNDNNYAHFEDNIFINNVDSSCIRSFPTSLDLFEAQCQYQQSVSRYVTDLWIAKNADVLVSSGAWQTNQMVNAKLNSVRFEDILSGSLSTITSAWNKNQCKTAIFEGSSLASTNCSFSSQASKEALLANTSVLCIGTVKSISYTVNHNATATGTIASVLADVVLTDIPMIYNDQSVQIRQSFTVNYSSVNSAGLSTTNGNLVRRQRSGNPGYVLGFPVLYGFANGSKIIDELVSGLTVATSTGSNICPTSYSEIIYSPTSFGYDSVTGCNINLNRQQMINFCCTGAPGTCLDNSVSSVTEDSPYTAANGIPYVLNFTQGYVGIYGDADPLDITQWFQITYSSTTDTRQWNDKTATCSNVFSGLNIQFLVSFSGERTNPQNKIVSALAEVVTSDWVFRAPVGDNTTTQAFQLSVIVSYIFQNEEKLQGYEPPAPPALFKVPYDVFYPFVVNGVSAQNSYSFVWPTIVFVFLCTHLTMV